MSDTSPAVVTPRSVGALDDTLRQPGDVGRVLSRGR